MTTPVLGAAELVSAQAIPETTVNEIVRRLEQGAGAFSVISQTTTPPGSPADGDSHIVTATATGAWTGWEKSIAYYQTGTGWLRITPRDGMIAWDQNLNKALVYGTVWVDLVSASGGGDLLAANNLSDLANAATARTNLGINSTNVKLTESLIVAVSDELTALTTGTGKLTFRMPYAFTLSNVRASLTTAQTSGSILTVDINENGTTILSTKLTIDNTEKTSTTAATAAVISDASLADDAEITIDIDQVGDGTAKGLKVYLIGARA
jgi:hypothetical protein